MNWLESIKGERKLSLNHWRFRILHWCFSVTYEKSTLPNFLYTHYCPLFHLTNLIAIFSPLIFVVKLTWSLIFQSFKILFSILFFFESVLKRIFTKKEKPAKKLSKEEEIRVNKNKEIKFIYNVLKNYDEGHDFKYFWYHNGCQFNILEKNEIKEIVESYLSKLIDAKKRSEERKKRFQNQMVFFVNFSRVFIKGFLNVFYFALFLTVAYATVKWILPGLYYGLLQAAELFKLLLTFNWLKFGSDSVYWFIRGCAVALAMYVAFKIVKLLVDVPVFKKALVPFSLIGSVILAFGKWIDNLLCNIIEFVSMFYEENCPPIVLVSEEEAEIEEKVQ